MIKIYIFWLLSYKIKHFPNICIKGQLDRHFSNMFVQLFCKCFYCSLLFFLSEIVIDYPRLYWLYELKISSTLYLFNPFTSLFKTKMPNIVPLFNIFLCSYIYLNHFKLSYTKITSLFFTLSFGSLIVL